MAIDVKTAPVPNIRKKRIDFLDIAKGIGILWVLIGHSKNICIPLSSSIAFSFHMPLFFILSGLCFSAKERIISGLFKRLVVPFYFTILLIVLYYSLCGQYGECKNWIWGGIYGSGYDITNPFFIKGVGGIWFFLALFWSKIILNSLVHLQEQIIIPLVLLLAYWGVYSYSFFVLPLEIQNGVVGLLFLYIGFLSQKYGLFTNMSWPLFVFSLIVWIMALFYNYAAFTLVNCKLELIHVITACCACYVVIMVSKSLEKTAVLKKILIWIGRNTLIILSFHIIELHTDISENIAYMLLSSSDGNVIFLVRLSWCLLFAFIIPKIPYLRRVYM